MMRLLSQLTQAQLTGKRVLVRGDLDAALSETGEVLEEFRLEKLIPTLQFLLKNQVKQIIIVGHLGRPQEAGGHMGPPLQLNTVAKSLSQLLGQSIIKLDEVVPAALPEDKILMLENLRFDPREESNDLEFAKALSTFGDLFVNDSFATCHRAHASMVGIPKFLPAYAGLQLEKEVGVLSKVLAGPERPLVILIGGAKLETKLPVIDNFLGKADSILVGGKIGFDPGVEKYSHTQVDAVVLPVDSIGEKKDIGPETVKIFSDIVKNAANIIWNGPMGMFEDPAYKKGTENMAAVVATSNAFKVVGGGDTVEALRNLKLLDKMDFVSTGGGAMLEFLAGKELPGINSLK